MLMPRFKTVSDDGTLPSLLSNVITGAPLQRRWARSRGSAPRPLHCGIFISL